MVEEYDTSGLIAHYTYGLGLVSRTDATGSAAYYDFDARGNTVGITGSTGTYVNQYSYLPFGETTTTSASLPNPFTFAGQVGVMQIGTNLFYMRARFYTPAEGRFLNPDPAGIGGGVNLYAYALNQPTGYIDASGTGSRPVQGVNGPKPGPRGQGGQTGGQGGQTGGQGGQTGPKSLEELLNELEEATNSPAWPGTGNGGLDTNFKERLQEERKNLERLQEERNKLEQELKNIETAKKVIAGAGIVITAGVVGGLIGGLVGAGGLIFGSALIAEAHDPNNIIGPAGFGDRELRFHRPGPALPDRLRERAHCGPPRPAGDDHRAARLEPELAILPPGQLRLRRHDLPGSRQLRLLPDPDRPDQATTATMSMSAATIDERTGIATWTFTTIDPATGQIPLDPTLGFLPPDNANGIGEGFVSYTVMANPSDPTGTVINAQATVDFYTQPPINTPQIFNTIDAGTGLTSTVAALPSEETSPSSTSPGPGPTPPPARRSPPSRSSSRTMAGRTPPG